MSGLSTILCADLRPSEAYRLLIGVLVPRPIAWVTTRSVDGVVNAAPFSFYAGITANPPIVGLGIGRRRDGSRKDTARNALTTGELVIHLSELPMLEQIVATSAEYAPEVGEPETLGLALEESRCVSVPALADTRVRLECRLHQHHEVGDGPVDFLLAEVVAFRLRPELLDGRLVREEELAPVGRLGSTLYAPVERRVDLPRPAAPG